MYGIMIIGGALTCRTIPKSRKILGCLNFDIITPSDTKADTVSKSIKSAKQKNR